MLVKVLIFPGLLFLGIYGMIFEFLDRKMFARMQNRVGPKWYIPFADFVKLVGKQSVIPKDANKWMMKLMPYLALAGVACAFVYIPAAGLTPAFSFEGDIIIVLYFLSFPAFAQFLAGWYSRSLYATVGASRVVTQMFAYEVPLFMSLLAPAVTAGSWSVAGISSFFSAHPLCVLVNLPAFAVAVAASQCKLARAPFDAPEAETEIVSGPYVEYGGRLLAFFRMSVDCETVTVISLIAAVFVPFGTGIIPVDLLLWVIKTVIILFLTTLLRAVMARLRINQTVTFCWKGLAPIALLQMIVDLLLRRWIA